MSKPVLSICIPTRNRANYLDITLARLTSEKVFLDSDKVEIILSDNCSEDNTGEVCLKYVSKFPCKIKYIKQEKNIDDRNFIEVLKLAKGKYAKLHNDTLYFYENMLGTLVSVLENSSFVTCFILNNADQNNEIDVVNFENFDKFIAEKTYFCTWIGGFCVNVEAFKNLDTPDRFSELQLAQVDILARLTKQNPINLISGRLFIQNPLLNKGGYNIAHIFGENFIIILKQLIKEGIISKKTYDKVIKETLLRHINYYHFDYHKKYKFHKGGYFKYLFKYYKTKPYYYLNYLKHLLKKFARLFVKIIRTDDYLTITIFGSISVNMRIKSLEKRWKSKNTHNRVVLSNYAVQDKVVVGKGSYGVVNALFSNRNDLRRLIIGNYCSIAEGVKFLVCGEHSYKTFSTYPFGVYNFGAVGEAFSKGDIVVKDDVWIGYNAIILSGVTIGQGAVIAAGAVVTKDVPSYSVVGGNPAKVIKYRFDKSVIEKLEKFDFSKLTDEKIQRPGALLYREVSPDNVDELLREFQSDVR